ncbi:MAG: ABC transporter ATP-binding protein [Candidatus Kariarchaeaceae archaeon]|jgi:peptide/nickel transport system ATP-binding protein
MTEAIKITGLSKTFKSGIIVRQVTQAVKNASFSIERGKIVCLVGESGSGKSTIAKILLKLEKRTEGSILIDGIELDDYNNKEYYRKVQPIFQDPYASINYFYKIDRVLKQALDLRGERLTAEQERDLMHEALDKVKIDAEEILGRYPHQLSGGQLQRFLIARILLIKPEIVIADEITSMIDASSRAGILNLLLELRESENMTLLFITHDIAQAQYLSDDILVLEEGVLVEQGPTNDVLTNPQHEYTKLLLSCVPSLYQKWDLDEE